MDQYQERRDGFVLPMHKNTFALQSTLDPGLAAAMLNGIVPTRP